MYIQQLYTSCLSEAAYYIESNGEAAVIDPLRDTDTYVQLAQSRGARIRYIFETHFHADFVSGHLDLSQQTGAPIIYGPDAHTAFEKYTAKDGEQFPLGELTIQAWHTPGHTLESTCYLLNDAAGNPHALFSGDTLFVGDVGRPDLFSGNLSKESLASLLYDSLQKIKTLPDTVLLYPAHGPGSSCGKKLGPNTHSTIGEEKLHNYAMQDMNREAFIDEVTEDLKTPPVYFPLNAGINRQGYSSMDTLKQKGLQPLSVEAFKKHMQEGVYVLDTRPVTLFTAGFVPGAVSIGLEGRFAEWAGALLPFNQPLILITEKGKEEESLIRLARVGLDQVSGYLQGGYEAWQESGEPIDMIIDIEADELRMDMNYDPNLVVVDVRKEPEYESGHVQGALSLPLDQFNDLTRISSFEENENLYLHCAGGYRSVIACSLLKRQGLHNLRNVLGGYEQIKKVAGMPLVAAIEMLN